MQNTTVRLSFADAYKFVAIVAVISAHLPPGGRFDGEAWATVQSIQDLTGWCVLAFFAVSGVLLRPSLERPIGAELIKRARRLLIPWLAFSVFYKVAVLALTLAGVIKNAQPIPSGGWDLLRWVVQPADPQLYFLLYLFLMQVFLLFLHRLNDCVPLIVGVVAFLSWSVFLFPDSGAPLLHGASLQLVPLYFAFLTFGLFCGSSLKRVAVVSALACLASLIIAVTRGNWLVAWQLVAPWVLLLALRAGEGSPALKPVACLGRFSGGVYVWHAPLIMGAVSIVSVALLGSGFTAVLATVVLCFACSALVGTWVNRTPRLRWFHI
jgi:fucose 4-O-acetylase-like acetyltransferase